jgi:NADPH:quinone reductase-like Zn-dependent oxidoreductase
MRQVRIGASYGVDNLHVDETDIPTPGPGEVLIKVKAASLNYRDWEIVNGEYHTNYSQGVVPISDGAGQVIDVGPDVTEFHSGDRVVASFWQDWNSGELGQSPTARTVGGPIDGLLSEYRVFPEQSLVRIPEVLNFEQAATLPCAAVTAWQSLVTKGHLNSGDWVLIQGTGGVSIFALQIACMHGARAIVLSSSDRKLDIARQHGAIAQINYQSTPDWAQKVRDITGGQGVDHIVEVGGPETFAQSLASVSVGGQINVIGYVGGKQGSVNPLQILQAHALVRGIAAGPTSSLRALCKSIEANHLVPVIDSAYHWLDYKEALAHLQSGKHFGKIVLKF